MTLQQDVAMQTVGKLACLEEALGAVAAGDACQTIQLPRVRSVDEVLRQLLHPGTVTGKDIECIGIHHNRTGASSELGNQGDGTSLAGSQSRTDAHGVVIFRIYRFAEDGFLCIHLQYRLGHGNLHDFVVSLRRMGNHLSHTCSEAGSGGKDRSARHAVAACDEECRAHAALVGEVAARLQELADIFFFEDAATALGALDELWRESDIKYLDSAQVLLVVCHHHRQLLLLQGEGEVGTDDVGADVVGIVLAHQTGRQVDAHDLCRTLVDVFHHGSESARQRLVESAAKETIYHEHSRLELRRVEVDGDLGKLLDALTLNESFLVGGTVGRKLVAHIEQKYTHPISVFAEKACHGKCITTIVSRTGENHDRRSVRPFLLDGTGERLCRPFHQVERCDRLMLNGVFIQLMYLSTSEYFHILMYVMSDYLINLMQKY